MRKGPESLELALDVGETLHIPSCISAADLVQPFLRRHCGAETRLSSRLSFLTIAEVH